MTRRTVTGQYSTGVKLPDDLVVTPLQYID
jgi:hypothetical protein